MCPSHICLHNSVADVMMQGNKYRVTAYDSIVTIVEPETSWFDFKAYVTEYTRLQ